MQNAIGHLLLTGALVLLECGTPKVLGASAISVLGLLSGQGIDNSCVEVKTNPVNCSPGTNLNLTGGSSIYGLVQGGFIKSSLVANLTPIPDGTLVAAGILGNLNILFDEDLAARDARNGVFFNGSFLIHSVFSANIEASADSLASAEIDYYIPANPNNRVQGNVSARLGSSESKTLSNDSYFSVPVVNGQALIRVQEILRIRCNAYLASGIGNGSCFARIDSMNSAHLGDLRAFDVSGNEVPLSQLIITSGSGYDYTQPVSTNSETPEPATFTLMASCLAVSGLVGARRGRLRKMFGSPRDE